MVTDLLKYDKMDFQLINKFKNSSAIDVTNEKYKFFFDKEGVVKRDKFSFELLSSLKCSYREFYSFYENYFYINTDHRSIIKIRKSDFSHIIDDHNEVLFLHTYKNEKKIPVKIKVNKQKFLGIYDLLNREIIWKVNRSYSLAYYSEDKILIVGDHSDISSFAKKIKSLSLKDGSVLWQLDVGEIGRYDNPHLGNVPGEVKKVIGVYNNQELLVAVSNGILLGVNIETGKVLWQVNKMPDLGWVKEEIKKVKFGSAETLQFVKPNRLVSLAGYTYCEFNLETRQIENVRYHSDYVNGRYFYDVNASGFIAKGDYIYYADDTPTSIAIYERSTGKVIWQYQFEENVRLGNPSNIQVDNDGSRIYLNDTNGTLYVFEKV